jgi:NAD(P)-dependent dehydrogenase (short-subunit alcohol dehydrogenase family)
MMLKGNIFDLSGKVVLVTGGGSGIGRAYCEAVAEFGADVVCSDLVAENAEETVSIIRTFGHGAVAVKADASKEEDIQLMVNRSIKEFGTIDVAFANAGTADKDLVPIHEKSVEDWDAVMALQPRGTFLLMKAVFPIMMKKKEGSFICTASIGGLTTTCAGGPFQVLAAYQTAKAGVILLTKMASRQYGEYGIRVNAICPGYVRTAMAPSEEIRAMLEEHILAFTPLKRIGMPDELKGLAVWLASDASAFVTGQTFVQDGGMIA